MKQKDTIIEEKAEPMETFTYRMLPAEHAIADTACKKKHGKGLSAVVRDLIKGRFPTGKK